MFPKIHLFKKRDYAYLLVAASVIAGGIAIANTQGAKAPLQNTMTAYVVSTDQAGKEVLEPATEVAPGQTVEYQLTYENTSTDPLKDLIVTGPVPRVTAYIGKSAFTEAKANLQVSIDGGKTFENEPVKRLVKDANGKKVERIIPPSAYTHLRWMMKEPLNAGEVKNFAYRSVVK